jgi:hypothetical protein
MRRFILGLIFGAMAGAAWAVAITAIAAAS